MYFKNAFAYYNFIDVKGNALDYSSKNKHAGSHKVLKYDYEPVVVSGELGFIIPVLRRCRLPRCMVNMLRIPQAAIKKIPGMPAGVKFGHEKIKEPGQWQATAYYEKLEQDAWLDTFPDSDAYGGSTNTKGYVVKAGYGLMKNVELNTAYYPH